LHSPRRQHFERCHLVSEVRNVHRYGKFQNEEGPKIRIGEKNLRVARVNEDSTKKEAADPNDRAA
jgi:hypothetical protein